MATERSVNFVTCHDGFTLNDLISYNVKTTREWEGNRDDDNRAELRVEGPEDATVEELRNRQVKNFLTLTLLALGTPMLLMGDEVRRTQAATTTRTVTMTKRVGSTGRCSNARRRASLREATRLSSPSPPGPAWSARSDAG